MNKKNELEKEITRLKKINEALMKRVERDLSDQKDAFSLFEGNILLEKQIKERTQSLEKITNQYLLEKNKIGQIIKALPGDIIIFDQDYTISQYIEGRFSTQTNSTFPTNLLDFFDGTFSTPLKEAVQLTKENSFSSFDFINKPGSEDSTCYSCGISFLNKDQYVLYLKDKTEEFLQTEKMRSQEIQLVQASRLSALGEMAGGVAHEINTPLGAILLASSQIKKLFLSPKEPDRAKVIKYTDMIIKTVDNVGKIVQSLRQVSRDASSDSLEPCLLSDIIEDAAGLCRERFRSFGVQLFIEQIDNQTVLAKRIEISQVILNLLNNAFYIAKQADNGWIRLQCKRQENSIRVTVVDSGKGISNEVLEKIFQPFFTTKPIGEGTGLGMSVSQRIVNKHSSQLKYKLLDGNTAFYFELQCYKKEKIAA